MAMSTSPATPPFVAAAGERLAQRQLANRGLPQPRPDRCRDRARRGRIPAPLASHEGNIMRPVNIASHKPYRGVNILTLWATADEKGYTSGMFGTYKQWAEAGAQVRKGETAAYIVFYKEITVASDEADSDECEPRLFARATPVFAAEQVDGYASPAPDTPATSITPIEQAEAFVARDRRGHPSRRQSRLLSPFD